jgi:hypothetical protein
MWPLDRLVPYERNARTHSPEQIAQIAASIQEFGFTNPILVDGADGILAGHGRLAAAKDMGLAEVPVIVLDHLSAAQRRAYILADNQLALNAGWDMELLQQEIVGLNLADFDLSLLGFDDEMIAGLLDPEGIDDDRGGESEGGDGKDNPYTDKIKAPIYEPSDNPPSIDDLFNRSKTLEAINRINKADIQEDVKDFLISAAERLTVFEYRKVADFYAHASADIQDLMERLALVVVDYDKAIELGFVQLSAEIDQAWKGDYPDA